MIYDDEKYVEEERKSEKCGSVMGKHNFKLFLIMSDVKHDQT